MPEARLHDERILPHQVRGDLEAMFPRAIAGEEEHEEPQASDIIKEMGRSIGRNLPGWRRLGLEARVRRLLGLWLLAAAGGTSSASIGPMAAGGTESEPPE